MGKFIVTGAAGGVGRACVSLLRSQDAEVAALDVNDAELKKLYAEDKKIKVVHLDLASASSCREAVDRSVELLGGLDALLHFGAAWTGSDWRATDEAEWARILATNVTGSFLVARAAAEHLIKQGGGNIVLTASTSAKIGGAAGGPAYVSSKAGVIGLTRSLAKALGPHRIRVNAVNPGMLETAMTKTWPEELKRRVIDQTPLGRIGQPIDIAEVACFLASPKASFMTGEVVEVNGGTYFG